MLELTERPINILVVDDDDVSAEGVERSLRKGELKFTITSAADGLEALEILRGEHGEKSVHAPLLVLLDLNMPRMDGLDFLQHIRGDQQLHKIVVFVLTTSNRDRDRAAAYQKHVAGYIVKSRAGPQFTKLAEFLNCYGKSISLP